MPVWIAVAVFLILLVALPIGWVLVTSVRTAQTSLTLANYLAAFTDRDLLQPILVTLGVGLGVGVLSVLVGAPMGWLVARTDLPSRRLIKNLVLASFVTPPFLGAFCWTLLAGPNAGVINTWWRNLTGSSTPLFNVYSVAGLVFVTFLYCFPFVFALLTNALDLISTDVEEAAGILGASPLRTSLTVTLPLVAPAILGGFILAFLQALTEFGPPAILALPAGFHTITTRIWALFQFPPHLEIAAAYSMPLLLVSVLLLGLQRRLLRRRGYATVLGKTVGRRPIKLGWAALPALVLCYGVLGLSIFLPYFILIRAAVSRAWAQPLTIENFTVDNFGFALFGYSATVQAIGNTVKLGVLTASVGTLLAVIVAYVVHRRIIRVASLLAFVATAPLAVPGIVLAVGLFLAYTRPPLILYGTLWILFLAYLTRELPVGFAQTENTMRSIHVELEEASRILGATRLRALRDIMLPLARSGVAATWCFVFIGAIRELSASILLFTSQSRVVSVVMYDLKEEGKWEVISVLGILLLTCTFAIVAIVNRLGRQQTSLL
ncbi:MAG: iron ABC transporter permease [Chloroflexi bacterium]|nr:iron ABC transporter permease [Chloroflexota bacterium]